MLEYARPVSIDCWEGADPHSRNGRSLRPPSGSESAPWHLVRAALSCGVASMTRGYGVGALAAVAVGVVDAAIGLRSGWEAPILLDRLKWGFPGHARRVPSDTHPCQLASREVRVRINSGDFHREQWWAARVAGPLPLPLLLIDLLDWPDEGKAALLAVELADCEDDDLCLDIQEAAQCR